MKRLTLIRHAKSGGATPGLADFDRPLNERGLEDALRVGNLLAAEGFLPDAFVSSPALRALTTAQRIARQVGFDPAAIDESPDIYEAPPQRIAAVIRALPDSVEHAVVFGHNPGIGLLAEALLFRDEIDGFPTCAVCDLRLLPDSWAALDHDVAELLSFRSPKTWD
ncbi:phosphohistidine phosphatase SixA [soil metagenome]